MQLETFFIDFIDHLQPVQVELSCQCALINLPFRVFTVTRTFLSVKLLMINPKEGEVLRNNPFGFGGCSLWPLLISLTIY